MNKSSREKISGFSSPKLITYLGPSMYPTLKPGDLLQFMPYTGRSIRRGDVIVFLSEEEDLKIIHRVVSVDSGGIRTRGDNNSGTDTCILSPDRILGRVISAQKGGRWRRIVGGAAGPWVATAVRIVERADSKASSLLRPFYYRLARTGIFRRWPPKPLKPRVVSFGRPAGAELQLLLGRRMIGRRRPGNARWYIRRPFRLFVDETSLPKRGGRP